MQPPTALGASAPSVVDLLAAARAGCPYHLGPLLERYRSVLLLAARAQLSPGLRSQFGSSAVVQETFLRACQEFPAFRGTTEAELLAWLRAILHHVILNLRRRATAAMRTPAPGAAAPTRADGLEFDRPDSDQKTPSDCAARREESEALRKALALIPDDYRQVLVLHEAEGKTFEEIGRHLGRSADAVRKLRFRAIRELQKVLKPKPSSCDLPPH
jgi:RNA polymerase sigma-70 factor (ECF subfamily)